MNNLVYGRTSADLWANEQVLHACYSKVTPSVRVKNPELVSWSRHVADLLDLDYKE